MTKSETYCLVRVMRPTICWFSDSWNPIAELPANGAMGNFGLWFGLPREKGVMSCSLPAS